jgi:ribosomal protein S18 acetylase RimI-like enzyme
MMRAGADWAVAQGADTLAVLVTRANTAAQGLYASLGLKPVENYHYRVK